MPSPTVLRMSSLEADISRKPKIESACGPSHTFQQVVRFDLTIKLSKFGANRTRITSLGIKSHEGIIDSRVKSRVKSQKTEWRVLLARPPMRYADYRDGRSRHC